MPSTGLFGSRLATFVTRHARRMRIRRADAILFDRAGALVVSVPENGDPSELELQPGAAEAVARARAAGVAVAVVTSKTDDQDLAPESVERVNRRVDELVGQADIWLECPHQPEEECLCRMPAPGLIYLAAAALGTRPERCVVVGDLGADVEAAEAAGAQAILVPSARTSGDDLEAAPEVAASLTEAVAIVLGDAA